MSGKFDIKGALRERPIAGVWALLLGIVLLLNFKAGWEVDGVEIGAAFVFVALLGAYCASQVHEAAGARRIALWAVICGQLALGQWAGWQAIGLNLARNTAELDTHATSHASNMAALKTAQDERARLGQQRPVEAIRNDMRLEERKTSRNCKDGRCGNWTRLANELAAAERAAALDAQVPDLKRDLESGAQLTDANAPFRVAMTLSSAVVSKISGRPVEIGREDVLFGFKVFFVALLEFLATLGPWLLQLTAPARLPAPREAPGAWVNMINRRLEHAGSPRTAGHEARQSLSAWEAAAPDQLPARAAVAPGRVSARLGDDGLYQPQATQAPFFSVSAPLDAHPHPAQSHPPHGHQAQSHPAHAPQSNAVHGAPVHVNLYGMPGLSGPAPQAALPAPVAATVIDKVSDGNVTQLRALQKEAFAPAAPDGPTDRSKLNAALDGLCVFAAACVVPLDGAWVPADDMYEAYHAWAGPRAMSARAFHAMFEVATGCELRIVGDAPHYGNVKLRASAKEA